MSDFYEGQSVYLWWRADTWVRATVRQLDTAGPIELVEVDLQFEGSPHILLARPGELVKGDAG